LPATQPQHVASNPINVTPIIVSLFGFSSKIFFLTYHQDLLLLQPCPRFLVLLGMISNTLAPFLFFFFYL
jgi:hypothetical protein